MNNSVLGQLAVLPEKSTAELKQMWRDLYDREPPAYNKPFLYRPRFMGHRVEGYAALAAG
ncbi:MAG TPA: hypothetical protein VLT83_08270 [Opitutaceae bacterium]|nr:hypothetical protein [Opitutaceae bacterium]